MELFKRNMLLTKPKNSFHIQKKTGGLRGALIAGMVHLIDAKKKVTRPNPMENRVAELLATRNVELEIDSHICALKVFLQVDEQLWWIEKNPAGVSET